MSFVRRSNIAASPNSTAQALAPAPLAVAHRDYLEALPIPAALFQDSADGPRLTCANETFARIGGRRANSSDTARRLLADAGIGGEVAAFLVSSAPSRQFEWIDGDEISRRYYSVALSHLDRVADPALWLMTLIDRTAAIEAERSLRAEMLRDALTGLPNRTAFIEAADGAIEQDASHAGYAVLIVDLTRFSRVNESVGSLAGDELIITAARRLVSALRAGDMLARVGGDEFGILLALQDGPGDALHAAKRIQCALAAPFRLSDLEIRIDCAIGCALMNDAISMSEDLFRNAQFALKRAKVSGRVEVYQPGEVAVARRRFSMETELRRALEAGSLTLAYQPLVDLQQEKLAGFEALARWEHPEQGSIPPSEFISVAEESGLIVPLGRWAINEATRTLAAWDAANGSALPIHMAVNVSAVQLVRDDIAEVTRQALEASGLAGNRLVLELTESAIITDPERSGHLLDQLKALDAAIAMDDFGTGYSSLAYLQRLPIDVLKIDRSFVTSMIGDRDAVAIVRAILGLATALGMHTTAEGIETAEVANMLAALGCSYGQGFYFSYPLREADAFAFYRNFAQVRSAK